MAEFRLTVRIPGVNADALADPATATATISGLRDAVTAIAVEQLADHDELALLAAQRRVSSRWSLVGKNGGDEATIALVDVRLLNLPGSLTGADVGVLQSFLQAVAGDVVTWVNSGPGAAVKALAGGNVSGVKFDVEFLADVLVAQG